MTQIQISENSLLHDREFAIFDESGKYVNGKRTPDICRLRSSYDIEKYQMKIRVEGSKDTISFNLLEEQIKINEYLSDFFGYKVFIKQTHDGKFLDIPEYSGLTIISTSSLNALTGFFPEISSEQMRRRFRANIELSGVDAFREDNLFDKPGNTVEYRIGDVKLFGISPRARCIVPTRNPDTGITYPFFTKKFVEFREESLPSDSMIPEYEHFYYLSVDTFIPDSENGKTIFIGDKLEIIGVRNLQELNI